MSLQANGEAAPQLTPKLFGIPGLDVFQVAGFFGVKIFKPVFWGWILNLGGGMDVRVIENHKSTGNVVK